MTPPIPLYKLFVKPNLSPTKVFCSQPGAANDEEPEIWAGHLATIEGEAIGNIQFETDRARFLGRGQRLRSAVSVNEGWPLSIRSVACLSHFQFAAVCVAKGNCPPCF